MKQKPAKVRFADLPAGLRSVIHRMCNLVGADPETIDFAEPQWFLRHSWTQAGQDAFSRWLGREIRNRR